MAEGAGLDLHRIRAARIMQRAVGIVEALRFIAANGIPAVSPRRLHEAVEAHVGCLVPEAAVEAAVRIVSGGEQ